MPGDTSASSEQNGVISESYCGECGKMYCKTFPGVTIDELWGLEDGPHKSSNIWHKSQAPSNAA